VRTKIIPQKIRSHHATSDNEWRSCYQGLIPWTITKNSHQLEVITGINHWSILREKIYRTLASLSSMPPWCPTTAPPYTCLPSRDLRLGSATPCCWDSLSMMRKRAAPLHLQASAVIICSKNVALKREKRHWKYRQCPIREPRSRVSLRKIPIKEVATAKTMPSTRKRCQEAPASFASVFTCTVWH
jgi:hypothetical protein